MWDEEGADHGDGKNLEILQAFGRWSVKLIKESTIVGLMFLFCVVNEMCIASSVEMMWK